MTGVGSMPPERGGGGQPRANARLIEPNSTPHSLPAPNVNYRGSAQYGTRKDLERARVPVQSNVIEARVPVEARATVDARVPVEIRPLPEAMVPVEARVPAEVAVPIESYGQYNYNHQGLTRVVYEVPNQYPVLVSQPTQVVYEQYPDYSVTGAAQAQQVRHYVHSPPYQPYYAVAPGSTAHSYPSHQRHYPKPHYYVADSTTHHGGVGRTYPEQQPYPEQHVLYEAKQGSSRYRPTVVEQKASTNHGIITSQGSQGERGEQVRSVSRKRPLHEPSSNTKKKPKKSRRVCHHDDCSKYAQGPTKFCVRHGGGRRCAVEGCKKSAAGSTDKCFAHGGGKRCLRPLCQKAAIGPARLCFAHGGGKRCRVEGCNKGGRGIASLCTYHADQELARVANSEV